MTGSSIFEDDDEDLENDFIRRIDIIDQILKAKPKGKETTKMKV